MVSLDGADRREEVHLSNAAPRPVSQRLGYLPIMVRSSMCHLRSMNRTELVRHNEETNDMGGYFVCNGIERVVRMLIAVSSVCKGACVCWTATGMSLHRPRSLELFHTLAVAGDTCASALWVQTRRHYVLALNRGAYQKRGPLYTSTATLLRCVKPNMESQTVRCHYLTDGATCWGLAKCAHPKSAVIAVDLSASAASCTQGASISPSRFAKPSTSSRRACYSSALWR